MSAPDLNVYLALASLLLAACDAPNDKVLSRTFPAQGVTKVIVRSAYADSARVSHSGDKVSITGVRTGGADVFGPDGQRREIPPEGWGFDFIPTRDGTVLTIASTGEIDHLHHRYVLLGIRITAPPGVEVVTEKQSLGRAR